MAQEDQAVFEVVLDRRQAERGVHAHLTIGEVGAVRLPGLAEHFPQNACRIPDQILVADEDRIVTFV
jgi:hypothetical protein